MGLFASILGHIGDGNFHASIMYNKKDPEEKARVEKVVYDMVDRGLEMEGSCTVISHSPVLKKSYNMWLTLESVQGEHGIGLGKKNSLKKELGPDTIEVMRGIKKSLDPNWLLNPGKIFDYKEEP